ncbi:MAG: aspartate/glutamate racemase family protein [Geminicoccaceae bacterium]|jgi:maleate isomerase
MDQAHDRSHLPHELDSGLGVRARIGLIVLATDQTIEHEWRLIFQGLEGVAFYQSRIWNDPQITPETLRRMEGKLADSAAVIMPGLPLASLAFGCTSATMVIGEEGVFARLREARPEARPTTPITAAFAAFHVFSARRLAVLTPYRADVNAAVRRYVEARGFEVPVFGSFDEEDDHRAARIATASIRDAAIELGRDPRVDAVFVACTSLRVAEVAAEIEQAVGKPVTSSNHAMAWHALRLAGIEDRLPRWGRLFGR